MARPRKKPPYSAASAFVYQKGIAYGFQMVSRPQTLYGMRTHPSAWRYFLITTRAVYDLIGTAS